MIVQQPATIPREHIDMVLLQYCIDERVRSRDVTLRTAEEFLGFGAAIRGGCCGVCALYLKQVRVPRMRA